MRNDYRYVDVWVAGRMKSWQRVEVERCEEGFRRYPDAECYQSAQYFRSPVKSPKEDHFAHFYLDIDDKEKTGGGLELARRASRWLLGQGITGDRQRWVFSGGGGFHGYASGHALGVEPGPLVTRTFANLAEVLAAQAEIPTSPEAGCHLDLKVYTLPRLMRVPGTLHKSGLRAVELEFETLFECSVDEIRRSAAS